jgi:glycosyltransferase involved in cell wall biosynthesis
LHRTRPRYRVVVVSARSGDVASGRPKERPLRVAVLWLGRISNDTAGRTYLTELLGPLARQPGLEVDVHLGDPKFNAPPGCRVVRHRVPYAAGPFGRILAEPIVVARLRRAGYDVLLAPFNFLPPLWRGPSVLVQHNVLAFGSGLGDHLSRLRAFYRPRALARSVKHATEILAISGYLRDLLVAHYPNLDPSRVRVVHYGVSTALAAPPDRQSADNRRSTVLVVSALWPHKRVDQAIRAFAAAADGREAVLLIAGPAPDSHRKPLEALAAELGVRERVRFLGNVPHDQLRALYASADLLLYPSDVESFGLPLLEAMMAGVPVIAKRTPGQLEVADGAPLWVGADATDDEVAEALARMLDDPRLRAERIAAGRTRAESFTWERAAAETALALRDAASLPGLAVARGGHELADSR